MTIQTAQEQLAAIDKAINAILVTGQEYRHEGRTVRRADLAVLQRRRDQLMAELDAAAGRNTTVAEFYER